MKTNNFNESKLKGIKGTFAKRQKQNESSEYVLKIVGEKKTVKYPFPDIPDLQVIKDTLGEVQSIELLENNEKFKSYQFDVVNEEPGQKQDYKLKQVQDFFGYKVKALEDQNEILKNQLNDYKNEIVKNTNIGLENIKLKEENDFLKTNHVKYKKQTEIIASLLDYINNEADIEMVDYASEYFHLIGIKK